MFFPATAVAHNVSRFPVVLSADEFSPLYHSAVAEAFNATAGPPAPQPQPQPLLLLLLLLLLVTTAYVLKIKNRLSVVMTSSSQCQCCVCSSSCRMAAAVDTSAVPQFLPGLSPASASAAAAAAAAVCCCCWCCSHSLLCMFLMRAVFVVLIYAVRELFTKSHVSCTKPYRFFACHSCLDSQMSLDLWSF